MALSRLFPYPRTLTRRRTLGDGLGLGPGMLLHGKAHDGAVACHGTAWRGMLWCGTPCYGTSWTAMAWQGRPCHGIPSTAVKCLADVV